METTIEREFLDFRPEWKSYYLAMLGAEEYKRSPMYEEFTQAGWRITAYRYQHGWALYRERKRRDLRPLPLSAPLEPGMVGRSSFDSTEGTAMDGHLIALVSDSIERTTGTRDYDGDADLAASLLAEFPSLVTATTAYSANGITEADLDARVTAAIEESAASIASFAPALDSWHVSASSGEYVEQAASAREALALFEAAHTDDFVHSVALSIEGDDFSQSGAGRWTSRNNVYTITREAPNLYSVRAHGKMINVSSPARSYAEAVKSTQRHAKGER